MIYLAPGVEIDGQRDPAKDVEGELAPFSVPGMYSKHCDHDNLLFVIVAPEGMEAPVNWQEKTEAEINELYPGTFGG